jgi:hypothetical protein
LVLKRLRIGAAMGLAQEATAATVFPRGARRAEKKNLTQPRGPAGLFLGEIVI